MPPIELISVVLSYLTSPIPKAAYGELPIDCALSKKPAAMNGNTKNLFILSF